MRARFRLHTVAAALCAAMPSLALDSNDPVADTLDVSSYDVVELEIPTPTLDVSIDVIIEGQPFQLHLERHNLRSDDFQVLLQVEGGGYEVYEPELPMTYRGDVEGIEGSMVAASLIDDQLRAIVRTEFGTWGIQPMTEFDPDAAPKWHVVYNQENFVDQGWTCGVGGGLTATQGGATTFGTGLALTEIAFDTDFAVFLNMGQNVNNVINDIENITNIMSGIYEADAQIMFEITTIIVRTGFFGPYLTSDPNALLTAFANQWNTNQSFIRRDVAHLLTGINLDGSTIGIAFIGTVCDQGFGFGLSQTLFSGNLANRVGLTAHEVGHNYGATHCDGASGACNIMCSDLGGCSGGVSNFGSQARSQITSFSNSVGCNPELASPLLLPFVELFNGPGIPREHWPVRQNVSLSSNGIGEPSGNRSLLLNAQGPENFADDFIRSNVILLGNAEEQELTLFTQHRGVETGERLFIEYLNAQDDWTFLFEVISNGVDQTSFVEHNIPLPDDAYHDGFRFRMTADVDSADNEWFIDDVSIDDNFPCGGPDSYCVATTNSNSFFGAGMATSGSINVSDNDLVLQAFGAATDQVGIFYYGPDQLQTPFGNGFRCVGGQITRLPIVSTDLFGSASFPLDLNNLPPGGDIVPGDTTNIQFWFRDPVAGGAAFNLSDAISITWCP